MCVRVCVCVCVCVWLQHALEALPGCDVLFAGDSVMAMMWYPRPHSRTRASRARTPYARMLSTRTTSCRALTQRMGRALPTNGPGFSHRMGRALAHRWAQPTVRRAAAGRRATAALRREAATCALVRRGWELRTRESRLMVLVPRDKDSGKCKEVRTRAYAPCDECDPRSTASNG